MNESEHELKASLSTRDEQAAEIAEALGRKPGAIRSRLVKLGLVE